jgi:hypothetical protein
MTTTRAPDLVDTIRAACRAGRDDAALPVSTAEIRQALLAFGSQTPENRACAEQIDFGPSVGRRAGPERKVGLRIAGSNLLVSDILYETEDAGMPKAVRAACPDLTEDAWAAAMRLVMLILLSLECDS